MFRETTLTIADESTSDEVRRYITDLERHNRALKATVRLLDKCLTEASDDRDKYKAMWQANVESREKCHKLYRETKCQLDELNVAFDEYIKREKKLKSGYSYGKSESEKAADEFERLLDSGFFDDNQTIKDDILNKVHGKAMTVEEYLGGKTIEELKEEWIG